MSFIDSIHFSEEKPPSDSYVTGVCDTTIPRLEKRPTMPLCAGFIL
jgi:hypothetical protein